MIAALKKQLAEQQREIERLRAALTDLVEAGKLGE